MRRRRLPRRAAVGLATLLACSAGERPGDSDGSRDIPADWNTVTGNCGITLSAPNVLATSGVPDAECVAGFNTDVCAFNASLGRDVNPLRNGPGNIAGTYVSEDITLDGRPARLVRSVGPTAANSHFIGVHVSSIWEDDPEAGFTLTGLCPAGVEKEARQVVSSVRLPESAAAAAVPLEPTPDCSGADERAVEGYALGAGCPGPRVRVPGICAVGAELSGSTGSGSMLCFVAGEDFYYAHVQFGESVIGTGARHGHGDLFADQLSPAESERCAALIAQLPAWSAERTFPGYVPGPCP